MDFLVAAWSIPNGRIRKYLVTISKPTADLPSVPQKRESKTPFPCLFRRRASPNAF